MLLRVMRLLWYTSFAIHSLPASPHHSLSTLFRMNATIPSFIVVRKKKVDLFLEYKPILVIFISSLQSPLSRLICWYLHHQPILIWIHWTLYCIIWAQLWLRCSSVGEWQHCCVWSDLGYFFTGQTRSKRYPPPCLSHLPLSCWSVVTVVIPFNRTVTGYLQRQRQTGKPSTLLTSSFWWMSTTRDEYFWPFSIYSITELDSTWFLVIFQNSWLPPQCAPKVS